MGFCYQQLGELDQAVKHYEENIAMNLSAGSKSKELPNSYSNLGSIYSNRGEHAKAVDYYTKAIEIRSDFVNCIINRGLAYYSMKNYELAVKDYTKAIEIDPTKSSIYNNRGVAFF